MTDAISWRNPQVLRVLALVFLAGGLSGAVTYRVARMVKYAHNPPLPEPPPRLGDKKAVLDLLKGRLDLTPVQVDQVAAIIDDYKRYYGNIEDQVEEVRATGKNRILQVLDPRQRAKFEKVAASLR